MNEWLKKAFDFVNKITLEIKESDVRWAYRWVVDWKTIFKAKTMEEYEDTIWALKDELEENAIFIVEEKNTSVPFFADRTDLDNILLYKELYFLIWENKNDSTLKIPNFLLSSLFSSPKYSYDYYEVELSVLEWLKSENKLLFDLIKNIENIYFTQENYNENIKKWYLWLKNFSNIVLWYTKEWELFIEDWTHRFLALYDLIKNKTTFSWIHTKWNIWIKELLDIILNLNFISSNMIISSESLIKKSELKNIDISEIKKEDINKEVLNYLKTRNLI